MAPLSPRLWLDRVPAWARRPPVAVAIAAGAAGLLLVAVVLLRVPTGPAPRLTLPQANAEPTVVPSSPPTTGGAGAAPTPVAASTVTVHAAGAVVSAGIYAVPGGARVADVVTAAGGPLPDADLDRLNLAAHVADGDRVYVPRKGEATDAGDTSGAGGATGGAGVATTAPPGPLDLNTATAEQLDTLPGVGPAISQAIVTYRTRHGRFRSVTDLLDVPGIGPAKLEAIRPLVKV